MEWKYRGRSDTEATTAEPIPAPTGLSAQRDEGFQRFYKAVVSPTHVRVTAGGRIVPNTRGPPSPTTKRTNDNNIMGNHSLSDKEVIGQPPAALAGLSQAVPVVSPLVAGYPPGFQALQTPVSFVPMTLGTHLHPGFSFPQSAMSTASIAPLLPTSTLKDVHGTKGAGDDKQNRTKTPLPEPFYYNGQLMYPVGAFPGSLGSPVVPVHMVGIPQGVSPQPSCNFVQPQSTQPSSTTTASSYAPLNQSLSGLPPVVNHIVPANANFSGNAAPPISSIKPSDITKKQIASFKQSLKYHEDQLQYNRHQIDEKDMEQRIQIIKGHIQRFEQTLKTQLEYEEAHFKATQRKNGGEPAHDGTEVENKAQFQPPNLTVSPGCGVPSIKKESDEEVNQTGMVTTHGATTNVDQSEKGLRKSHVEPTSAGISSKQNAVGLSSEAATAPIFQPLGYASTWTGSKFVKEMKAYEEAKKGVNELEAGNADNFCKGEQRSVSQPFSASVAAMPRTEGSLHGPDERGRSGSNSSRHQSGYGVPYLLGTLPKGVNPRTARDQDYVYKRPLTEEERRARFLYWGKAPKSAVRGLPKYDGKHFYPPSPIKDPSPKQARDSSCRTTDSDGDPFRPITPIQRTGIKNASVSEDSCASATLARPISFETQVNGGSEDFIGGAPLQCENSPDATSVGQPDRRSDNASAKLWQAVLRKGATSSALSSTTAQGLLPHYTGNAAASLTPSLSTNQLSPSRDISSGKLPDVQDFGDNNGAVPTNVPERRGENCPPSNVSSLEDQVRHLSVDDAVRRDMAPTFTM
ncbi:hypothetical protein VTH82DRAFT_325 [Thermothelomyces myriococcoides]